MDIIAVIDAAIAPTCGWCEAALGGARQSDDFCSQDHQQQWHARQSDPLTTYVEYSHWGGDRARWFNRDRWYQALLDEVERVHPQYELTSRVAAQEAFERWAELVSPVWPCDECGTKVFQFQDRKGTRAWFQVGSIYAEDDAYRARVLQHTLQQCKDEQERNQLALFEKPAEKVTA